MQLSEVIHDLEQQRDQLQIQLEEVSQYTDLAKLHKRMSDLRTKIRRMDRQIKQVKEVDEL